MRVIGVPVCGHDSTRSPRKILKCDFTTSVAVIETAVHFPHVVNRIAMKEYIFADEVYDGDITKLQK